MLKGSSSSGPALRLYPRGFLGATINPQTERTPEPFSGVKSQTQYQVNDKKHGGGGPPSNPHVEALYAEYVKKNPAWNSFEFRERILRTALEAFGLVSFESWYQSQHQSPACGDMHNEFLTDTLKFITTGQRRMHLMSWSSLLHMTDDGSAIGPVSEEAEQFFKNRNHFMLNDVIQVWCSRDGGLEDLLGTLHILFGNA